MEKASEAVASTLKEMRAYAQPGMTTKHLDEYGAKILADFGAKSAPYLTYGFPGWTCICVNNEFCHGIPSDTTILKEGDLVNIDVSAELDGFFGDTGHTFIVGEVSAAKKHVVKTAQKALKYAITQVRAGVPLNVIGKAIETVARQNGCTVIRNLGSHGVGLGLHEEPFFIPPFFDEADNRMLHDGMVITIEPFISNGASEVKEASDGWTLFTPPQFATAQFEHTMVLTRTGAKILTAA